MDYATLVWQAVRNRSTVGSAAFATAVLIAISPPPARAQAFADAKSALVAYSNADIEPRKACEVLGKFKAQEIVQITAVAIPSASGAPAHCRVTGMISPEIAFEVSL